MLNSCELRLRKAVLDDADFILEVFSSNEFADAGIRELNRLQLERCAEDGFLFRFDTADGWLIFEEISGGDFGRVGAVKVQSSARNLLCTIVGGLRPDCIGKDIGGLFLKSTVNFLFNHAPVERIEVNILADNGRSIHMHESAGFKLEGIKRKAWFHAGELKDQYVMSLLRSEHGLMEKNL